ncbi:MAG: hypothetical protein ACLPGW_01155 [Roseiarcus sp.]
MKKGSRRAVVAHVRMNAEEHARFAELCRDRGITISAGLRRLAREAGAFGPSLDGQSSRDVRRMIAEWKAVGVNLNQVVRAMNVGRIPESQAIRARVQAALDQLRGHEAMFVSICGPRHARALEALESAEAAP